MTNVDQHHHHRLHILQTTTHHTNLLIFLQQSVISIRLKLYTTLSLILNPLQQLLLPFLQKRNQRIQKNKFTSDLTLSIVQLRRLLLYRISNRTLLLQHLVYYPTSLSNIRMVTLNLSSPVYHTINRLVDHYRCMRLFHYFVDLMTLCTNE